MYHFILHYLRNVYQIIEMTFIVLSALFILWTRNPLLAVLGLISVFLNSALLLLTMNVNFIALIYVIIYVGAICVLFLFVIMLLNLRHFDVHDKIMSLYPFFISYVIYLCICLFYIAVNINTASLDTDVYNTVIDSSDVTVISFNLFQNPLVFICITLLLLLALVASIVIAIRKEVHKQKQELYAAMSKTLATQVSIKQK